MILSLFEDRACPTAETKKQFQQDCQEIFASDAGARVLARLILGQHPLLHAPGMPEHAHGNAEVVAALWRNAAPVNSFPPPIVSKPTTQKHHASTKP